MFYLQKIGELKLKEIKLKNYKKAWQLKAFGKTQSQVGKKKKKTSEVIMVEIDPELKAFIQT